MSYMGSDNKMKEYSHNNEKYNPQFPGENSKFGES